MQIHWNIETTCRPHRSPKQFGLCDEPNLTGSLYWLCEGAKVRSRSSRVPLQPICLLWHMDFESKHSTNNYWNMCLPRLFPIDRITCSHTWSAYWSQLQKSFPRYGAIWHGPKHSTSAPCCSSCPEQWLLYPVRLRWRCLETEKYILRKATGKLLFRASYEQSPSSNIR